MNRTARATLIAIVPFLCAFIARSAHAQAPEGSDRLSPSAVAESLRVLHDLDGVVMGWHTDAPTWYHRGMLAWSLWERARHAPPVKGLDWTVMPARADESFRRALDLEPNNEQYFVSLAQFLLAAGVSYHPELGPYRVFDEHMTTVRTTGDKRLIANAALAAGRLHWLQYDEIWCKSYTGVSIAAYAEDQGGRLPRATVTGAPGAARVKAPPRALRFLTPEGTPEFAGEVPYLKAEWLFREAYDATPELAPTFMRYAMVLADQMRWTNLAALARNQVTLAPNDGWAWMTLGLATRALGDTKMAVAAFDTGLARMDPKERGRLIRIERVMAPMDAMRTGTFSDSSKVAREEFYWKNADPLWSVPGTEPRTEFLARITFAQLRWTQEELNIDGVNTDWGNTFIRTGRRPSPSEVGCTPKVMAWYFAKDSTILRGPAARWSPPASIRIDSMGTQVARFRATFDSTEVLVATLPPVASITKTSSVTGPVRTDFWLLGANLKEVGRDSVQPTKAGVQMFTHRLAPGAYVYRTETTADGGTVAGRATAGVVAGADPRTGFSIRGVGMSDFVLASRLHAKSGTPGRWSDFDATPILGPVASNSEISLLWENYDFGDDAGSAKYTVTVTLQREVNARSVAGRVAATIIGRVTRTKRTTDQVEFTFERTVPSAPTIVDNIALSLGKSPPGSYLVSLKVLDQVTGVTLGRSQRITVPAPPPPKPSLYGRGG